jgi:hypothetical protein
MKLIDKAILGMVSESSGCNESERIGDHRKTRLQGPSYRVDGEGNMDRPISESEVASDAQ